MAQHTAAPPRTGGGPNPAPGGLAPHTGRDLVLGTLMSLAALALFVAPWVVDYGPTQDSEAHTNELFVGLVVMLVGGARLFMPSRPRSDLVVLVAGAWLVASPFAIGAGDTLVSGRTRVYDLAVGSALVAMAVVSLALRAAARRTGRAPGGRPPAGEVHAGQAPGGGRLHAGRATAGPPAGRDGGRRP